MSLNHTVDEKLATRIKIGSVPEKAADAPKDLAQAAVLNNAEAGPSVPPIDEEQLDTIIPNLTSAQTEQQQRQHDLNRLNSMSIEDRRTITSMDMMGDFGSKVGYQHSSRSEWELTFCVDQLFGEASPMVPGQGFVHASRRLLKLVRQSSK